MRIICALRNIIRIYNITFIELISNIILPYFDLIFNHVYSVNVADNNYFVMSLFIFWKFTVDSRANKTSCELYVL